MLTFNNYLNERLNVNDNVKKISSMIFNQILLNLNELELNKKFELNNFLEKNYPIQIFFNDKMIFNVSDNFQAKVLKQISRKDVIINMEIQFNLRLDQITKLKRKIYHEMTHVIENFYSNNDLSKDWEVYKKLSKHREKYKKFEYWYDVSVLFHITLDQELRSRVSEIYELLKSKNSKDENLLKNVIFNSKEYISVISVLKIDPIVFLNSIKKEYPDDYKEILKDLMETVFDEEYSDDNFVKLINRSKNKVQKYKKKMLNQVSSIVYEDCNIVEDDFINIDFEKYISDHLK